jgi:predicted RNase H-like HicB family nuclease
MLPLPPYRLTCKTLYRILEPIGEAEAYGELPSRSEIISVVREDEADGGYTATALSYGIHTQGETLEQLRAMVKAAVGWYFDETVPAPKIIRVHFVRDEVLV